MESCDDQEARSLGDVSGAGDHRAAPSLEAWTPSLGGPWGRRLGGPAWTGPWYSGRGNHRQVIVPPAWA